MKRNATVASIVARRATSGEARRCRDFASRITRTRASAKSDAKIPRIAITWLVGKVADASFTMASLVMKNAIASRMAMMPRRLSMMAGVADNERPCESLGRTKGFVRLPGPRVETGRGGKRAPLAARFPESCRQAAFRPAPSFAASSIGPRFRRSRKAATSAPRRGAGDRPRSRRRAPNRPVPGSPGPSG